jgi:CRISPR-associated protein Csb1
MSETKTLTPSAVLSGESPLVLTATLVPVANQDRFQPAGFPEIGHVMYKAPRKNGTVENVCIVDSAASMANHLESVCVRGPHDPELVDDLAGMPYLRCVTGTIDEDGNLEGPNREVVVTSLTEGHRIASSYFLVGEYLISDGLKKPKAAKLRAEAKALKDSAAKGADDTKKTREKQAKDKTEEAKKIEDEAVFQNRLGREFGLVLADTKKAHPPTSKWWDVFKTIFKYDPNALVHGVLFPQWQIKISRVLTAHLEAFGAGRVERSGVKFDRIGKTTSGQPIFAVDDATSNEIRATFILDVALVRSFGRKGANTQLGLNEKQQEFLVALALWKINRLLGSPFRFRSGCHLQLVSLKSGESEIVLDVDIKAAIANALFTAPAVTDVYWPPNELYRQAEDEKPAETDGEDEVGAEDQEGDASE